MKRNKLLASLSICACLCLAVGIASCEKGKSKVENENKVLTGFEVESESTAELGSVYTIPIPSVFDTDRKMYDVEVSVTTGGEKVEVIGGMFEVSKTSDYTLTYTLNANGTTETKTTTLKVQDSQGPAIIMEGIKAKGVIGDTIDISSITAIDYSGVESVETEVKRGTVSVEVTDNKFVLDVAGQYVIKTTATDTNGKTSEKTFLTECLAKNQIYTFNTEQLGTKFGARYATLKQISNGPNNAGGCLQLVPTQGWFYMNWRSIGPGEAYEYDLSKAEYSEYAYVTLDVYYEASVASAIVYDFKNSGTTIETNKWISVAMPIESFNNGTQGYTPMWSSETPTAVYVDNIRLEKISPMAYDFEGSNVAGQFGSNQGATAMAKDPVNAENNVLQWNPTTQWAALNFWNFNQEQLSSSHYDAYHEMSFKIYVADETVDSASIGVFSTTVNTSIATNQWVTVTTKIKDIRENANAKYVCIWRNSTANYTVYFDDIQVTTFDGVLFDFDNRGTLGDFTAKTGANGATATQEIVANPHVTATNLANNVLKIDARPTVTLIFNDLKAKISAWEEITGLDYTRLTFDMYVDVALSGELAFDGLDANNDWDASGHGVEGKKWVTVNVDLTQSIYIQWMMWWNDEAGTKVGSIYIDNVKLYVN